jgi:hypothetical protein
VKETNVWLSPEELQHLLQGSLQWSDVASRISASKTRVRKMDETIFEKKAAPKQAVQPAYYPSRKKIRTSKRLEGQAVIWLLGSVGFLTLSSWVYFVLFAK